jgi:GNAT superfamily N-acetyltransferase
MPEQDDVTIDLLADRPALVRAVGILRWQEWGYDAPSPEAWIETTRREAGRDVLPVTLVAIDAAGHAVGAVALGEADEALTDGERGGRTPWLEGMVVREAARLRGTGRTLVVALERLARDRGHDQVWVVTGGQAKGFYRACGWVDVEDLVTSKDGLPSTVLARRLTPP